MSGTYTKAELRSIIAPILDRYGMASASLFGTNGTLKY